MRPLTHFVKTMGRALGNANTKEFNREQFSEKSGFGAGPGNTRVGIPGYTQVCDSKYPIVRPLTHFVKTMGRALGNANTKEFNREQFSEKSGFGAGPGNTRVGIPGYTQVCDSKYPIVRHSKIIKYNQKIIIYNQI